MLFDRVSTGLLQNSINSAEVVDSVLLTSDMCCVAQKIFRSSGQDPTFVKSWIFGEFGFIIMFDPVGFVPYVSVLKIVDPWPMSLEQKHIMMMKKWDGERICIHDRGQVMKTSILETSISVWIRSGRRGLITQIEFILAKKWATLIIFNLSDIVSLYAWLW